MSKVVVSIKIFPSDVKVDLGSLKETIKLNLPDYATLHKFTEEPIAYGLVALIAHIIIPEEKSGGLNEVEKRLREINETSELEILMVRRI